MALFASIKNVSTCVIRSCRRDLHSSLKLNGVVDGGAGTHKPTKFQQKILLWTKTYKAFEDIPPRVTKSQMKNAVDKFRVQVSIGMLGATAISAAIVIMYGKKEHEAGNSVRKINKEHFHRKDDD